MSDEPKISIIVPGYKCDEHIFRNIDSIFDQDYKNYEVIVVLNGEWETRKDLYAKLKEQYAGKIQVHWVPVGNLGNANNFGFSHSHGDIVSHLSSDLYLMPGCLRTWVEAFEDHPECKFVYSGYKFVSPNPLDIYYSNPFDRYHLECENYIDGANPYKREINKLWATNIKSLIDWDFFLSLTDDGTQGYYIKEPLYYAELPKKGGLSDDSSFNWIKRRKEIQGRHNIQDRPICITSLEFPEVALELAKIANADFRSYPGHKPHEYRLIYTYGFNCAEDNIRHSTGIFFQHYGHKIIHWVDSNIRGLMAHRWIDVDYYTTMVLSKITNHFCITDRGIATLTKMGLKPELLYPPVRYDLSMPKRETGISVSDGDVKDQLEKAMPDQKFYVRDLSCPISVHFEDDMTNILKSLCMGNHVITNYYMPSTHYIQAFNNVPELRRMLVHTLRKILKVNEPPDNETTQYYRDHTNMTHFRNKLERISEKKIQKYARMDEIGAEINA